MRKILNVCITYYTSGLERKRSVYERAVDPVLFSDYNGVCRKGRRVSAVVRKDPSHLREVL